MTHVNGMANFEAYFGETAITGDRLEFKRRAPAGLVHFVDGVLCQPGKHERWLGQWQPYHNNKVDAAFVIEKAASTL